MGNSAVFSSKDPALDFSFEYSEKEWLPQESRGRTEKYNVVYLNGPLDAGKRFKTLIEIVVKPAEKGGVASDLLDAFLIRMAGWPKFKIVRKGIVEVGNEKGSFAIYESEVRLPVESIDSKPVTVKEQAVFLVINGRSYRFSFHALADRWNDYLPAFERILKTFKFSK